MLIRFYGLQNTICEFEYYLENNKGNDTCQEQKNLDFFKRELEKLKPLIDEYEKNKCYIESDKEIMIDFVKKICEAINWGFEEINDTCKEILIRNDLHPKTYGTFKQRVLGTDASDRLIFVKCNQYFLGKKIEKLIGSEDKTVVWTILLNKYAILAPYYRKAPFIRFILKNRVMPYRKYQPVKSDYDKGEKICELSFGPFNFDIYNKPDDSKLAYSNDFLDYTLYDENNYKILPPLLRTAITITYTEFRDLLCYLNLPVFRSTKNRNMLFFPNYDLHQRLLEIQCFQRNYSAYTGESMDWKWFKEGETEAKEAIKCFCQEYEESPGYGIEPVEYVWYDIVYPDSNYIKKFIFLVVTFEELEYYTGSDIYKRDGKYYICNKDEVPDHMVDQLFIKKKLKHIDYIWYKEYLFFTTPFNETYHFNDFDIFKKDIKIFICNKKKVPESMMCDLLMKTKLEHVEHIWYKKNLFFVVAITDLDKYKKIYDNLYLFKKDEKYYIYHGKNLPEFIIKQLLNHYTLKNVEHIWIDDIILIKVIDSEYPDKDRIVLNKSKYIYNKELTKEQIHRLTKSSLREKYLKYKIKYLNLKKLLQKMNNNI